MIRPISRKVGAAWVNDEKIRPVHKALECLPCEGCSAVIKRGEYFAPVKTDLSFFALCQECLPFEEWHHE